MKHKISNLLITVVFSLFSTISGNSRSILLDRDYTGDFTLAPYEPEFIELK